MSADERELFAARKHQATTQGRDLADVLDQHGMLLTSQRARQLQSKVLLDLADMLNGTATHHWSDGTIRTPDDMRRSIAARVEKLAQATAKTGWK